MMKMLCQRPFFSNQAIYHVTKALALVGKDDHRSVIHLEEALEITEGDRELLVSIAEVFLSEGPAQLSAVRERIEAKDPAGIRKAAHHLKGSFVAFAAHRAAAAAVAVEEAAGDESLERILSTWNILNQEMSLLVSELKELSGQ